MDRGTGNGADRGAEKKTGQRALARNLGGVGWRGLDGVRVFYLESLTLLVVFTAVTVVLVSAFASAGRISGEAGVLSGAVHLAENAAEMAAASDSGEKLFGLLNEAGNASVLEASDGASRSVYRARYDSNTMPADEGIFCVDVSWSPERDGLVRSTVNVYWDDGTEPVYALDLAVYIGGL